MNRKNLIGAYARLKGIERLVSIHSGPPHEAGRDYNDTVRVIDEAINEDLSYLIIPEAAFNNDMYGGQFISSDIFKLKLWQAIQYLEHTQHIHEQVVEIGSLYNSISDEELKSRCADLLSAPAHFDRVINQATQVLENRIRARSKLDGNLSGSDLVNRAISSDPTKTRLRVSDDVGEQRGFSDICRGIMQAFRNPTHHKIADSFTREDALKVCAFIDNLLRVIDQAQFVERP